MNLDEILEQSPECRGYSGGQWAMYSVGCCWWTSFPEDLGNTESFKAKMLRMALGAGSADVSSPEPSKSLRGLPCCPHCGSVLMMAPLAKFIAAAQANPAHYGPGGLETFVEAHSRNSPGCRGKWSDYPLMPERYG